MQLSLYMQKCAHTLCLYPVFGYVNDGRTKYSWFCTSLCFIRCSLLVQGGPLFLLQDLSTNGGRLLTRPSDAAALVYPAMLSSTYFQLCAGKSLPPLRKRRKQFEVTVSEKVECLLDGKCMRRHVSKREAYPKGHVARARGRRPRAPGRRQRY